MKDSLLTNKQKLLIKQLIAAGDFPALISVLDSVSTSHAGTAKMKDKKFAITEIVKYIKLNNKQNEKAFFSAGKKILSVKSDNAKEIGIHIIWRAYRLHKKTVEKILFNAANDPNWEVREYAAGALCAVIDVFPEFYQSLQKWSKNKSENIRRSVVMSAIGLRDDSQKGNLMKAFKLLEPLLSDSSAYVKKNLGPFVLGSYFGNSYPKETLKQLNKWVKLHDPNVRWNIAMTFNNSFGSKYPSEALKFLKILAVDKNPVVKRAVKSTLRHLKKRHKSLNIEAIILE